MRPSLRTSAIVTCHNYGKYLRTCLDSLLNQSLPFHEIILVDDASEDDTFSLWNASYRTKVRYLRADYRAQMASRNHGVREATGELIVHIDADNWLSAEFHQNMIQPLLDNPLLGFSYCAVAPVNEAGLATEALPHLPRRKFDPYMLWKGNYVPDCALFRRAAWQGTKRPFGIKLKGNTTYGEDWDQWLEMTRQGWTGKRVRKTLAYYRLHGENISWDVFTQPELRDTCTWAIKERYLVHELTIVVLMKTGRRPMLERLIDSLRRLDKPANTQILFAGSFRPEERPCDWNILPDTRFLTVRTEAETDDSWKIKALAAVRPHVSGRKILLLDEDILLQPDAYMQLSSGLINTRADLYSACIPLPTGEGPVALRAVNGRPEKGFYFSPVVRGPKRVYAASCKAVLMHARLFHEVELTAKDLQRSFGSMELTYAGIVWGKNMRWFVNGRIRAARFDSAGRSIHKGYIREIRRQPAQPGLPAVSVIIPVLNGDRHIADLLTSLKAVDYPGHKMEILVVDNNSTDKTAAVVSQFEGVRLLHESKPSSYAARNKGIRESRHEILVFVDADLEVEKNWLKELVAPFLEDPAAGLVGGSNSAFELSLLPALERKYGGYCNRPHDPASPVPAFVITMNAAFRRRVFDDLGLFDDAQISGADVDMSWRIQSQSSWKIRLLDERARVRHKDVTKVREAVHRYLRIGSGNFGLYMRYPHLLNADYFWLPQTLWEMLLQLIKNCFSALRKHGFSKSNHRVTADKIFLTLRTCLHKYGYWKTLRHHIKALKHTRPNTGLAVYGKKTLSPNTRAAYDELWALAAAGTRIVHLDPPQTLSSSWRQVFVGLMGGTTAWHWHPNLLSLERWRLLPGENRFRWIKTFHDRVNAYRALKALALAKDGRLFMREKKFPGNMRVWTQACAKQGIAFVLGESRLNLPSFLTHEHKTSTAFVSASQPAAEPVPTSCLA